jgi:hypothetical protein
MTGAIRKEAEAERSRARMRRWGIAIMLCGAAGETAKALLVNSLHP